LNEPRTDWNYPRPQLQHMADMNSPVQLVLLVGTAHLKYM